jgi:multiple sugar transport system permease protein
MVPLVSAVYIWQGVLNPETGWINRALNSICLPHWLANLAGQPEWATTACVRGPDWLNSITWIYPGLVIIGLWGVGNMMILHLAALQGVPTELLEAAKVDGAGPTTVFFRVTLPMITPVVFYNLVLTSIGIFQYFIIPYILSNGTGRPGNSTLFYAMHLYREAFSYSDMGYGSTLAWALFLAAGVITLILFGTQRRWVYYAAGEANR